MDRWQTVWKVCAAASVTATAAYLLIKYDPTPLWIGELLTKKKKKRVKKDTTHYESFLHKCQQGNAKEDKEVVDVLVVGAGPVGLQLAVELSHYGCSCLVIEKLASPSPYVKALGITPRTFLQWRQTGLAKQMLAKSGDSRPEGFLTLLNGKLKKHEIEVRHELEELRGEVLKKSGGCEWKRLPQYDVERILSKRLEENYYTKIRRSTELKYFKELSDGSVAAVVESVHNNSKMLEIVKCKYVVGCDGAHSMVRHLLEDKDVSYDGARIPMLMAVSDVDLKMPQSIPKGISLICQKKIFFDSLMIGGGAVIPVPGPEQDRYRLSVSAPFWMNTDPDTQPEDPPDLAILQQQIKGLLPEGSVVSKLRWSSWYRMSHRIASKYHVGKAFIIGDAAHIHPPIGGLGMNTGLQDANNLSWKLAMALKHKLSDPEKLFNTFNEERYSVGMDVVQSTAKRMNRVMKGATHKENPVYEAIKTSQMYIKYDSPVEGGGSLAPDIPLQRIESGSKSMSNIPLYQLIYKSRGRHILLLLVDQEIHLVHDIPSWIYKVAVVKSKLKLKDWTLVKDTLEERNLKSEYGLKPGGGVLIRPDGYIAFPFVGRKDFEDKMSTYTVALGITKA